MELKLILQIVGFTLGLLYLWLDTGPTSTSGSWGW